MNQKLLVSLMVATLSALAFVFTLIFVVETVPLTPEITYKVLSILLLSVLALIISIGYILKSWEGIWFKIITSRKKS